METRTVDAYGNVGDITVSERDFDLQAAANDPIPRSVTTEHVVTTFAPTAQQISDWLIALPSDETVESSARCTLLSECLAEKKTRHATFDFYPGTALLREETRELGKAALQRVTHFDRDPFGNVSTVTTTANTTASGTQRSLTIGYDSRGIFPVSITRAGQVTQLRYDERFGRPTVVVDPNGIDETFAYDEFGILRRQHGPGGDSELDYEPAEQHLGTQFSDSSAMTIPARYRVFSHQLGGERAVEEYDSRDRLVQRVVGGLTAPNTSPSSVVEEFRYNARGLMVRATRPHLVGDPSQSYIDYEYDELKRPLREIYPDGSVVTRSYASAADLIPAYQQFLSSAARNLVLLTDEKNHETLQQLDRDGRMVRITDAMRQSTDYAFNAFGRVRNIVAPDGATIKYETDDYNRVSSITDAAFGGKYAIEYDGFDEVTLTRDPALREARFYYDNLGRRTQVDDDDGTTTFTYDGDNTRPNEIGRLIKTVSPTFQETRYAFEAPTAGRNRGLLQSITQVLLPPDSSSPDSVAHDDLPLRRGIATRDGRLSFSRRRQLQCHEPVR